MCKGRGDCSRDQRWGKGESVVISRGLQICSTELNGSYSADLSPISLGIPSARGVPLSKSQLLIHRYLSTELRESRCGNYGRRSLLCQGFPSACPRRAHWHHVQGVLHWTHVYTCRPQSRAAQHGGGDTGYLRWYQRRDNSSEGWNICGINSRQALVILACPLPPSSSPSPFPPSSRALFRSFPILGETMERDHGSLAQLGLGKLLRLEARVKFGSRHQPLSHPQM